MCTRCLQCVHTPHQVQLSAHVGTLRSLRLELQCTARTHAVTGSYYLSKLSVEPNRFSGSVDKWKQNASWIKLGEVKIVNRRKCFLLVQTSWNFFEFVATKCFLGIFNKFAARAPLGEFTVRSIDVLDDRTFVVLFAEFLFRATTSNKSIYYSVFARDLRLLVHGELNWKA